MLELPLQRRCTVSDLPRNADCARLDRGGMAGVARGGVDQPARCADPAEYKCWYSSDEYGRATGIRNVNRRGSHSIRGGGLERPTK
jgi:hypothetical protein